MTASPSRALQLALDGDLEVVHQLSFEEVLAVAEQRQLEDELLQLDLTGVRALAYVLTAKCGSLKRAFKWLDLNRKGRIAQVTWDTGMCLLRIDTKRLTGLFPTDIFHMIDIDPRDGLITKSEWKTFFQAVEENTLNDLLKAAACGPRGTLAKRASHRADELRSRLAVPPGSRGGGSKQSGRSTANGSRGSQRPAGASHLGVGAAAADGGAAEAEGRGWRRPASGAGAAWQGGGPGSSRGSAGSGGAPGRTGSRSRGRAVSPAAAADGSASAAHGVKKGGAEDLDPAAFLQLQEDFREQVLRALSQLSLDQDKEYAALAPWQAEIVRQVAAGLELFCADTDTGCWVCDCLDFASETREDLVRIAAGDFLELSPELCQNRRRAVHCLAEDFWYLTAKTEVIGEQRRVVVFYLSDFADEVRRALTALKPGESKAFLSELTATQKRLCHLIAKELGLWSHETSFGSMSSVVEVMHLADFAAEVRSVLLPLQPGEEHKFSTSLSEHQIKVVHCVAVELGLVACDLNEKKGRCVAVGHHLGFREQARAAMQALAPGEAHVFEAATTNLQGIIVRVLGSELKISVELVGKGEDARLHATHKVPNEADPRGRGSRGSVAEGQREPLDVDPSAAEEQAELARLRELRAQREAAPAAARRPDAKKDESSEGSTAALWANIFNKYATGNHNGERIFLRFPDLRKFAEDAKGISPEAHSIFCQFEGVLESTFEDTVQLQCDMGTKTKKGLTLHWFQVFVQKSLTRLGLQIVSLLMALLSQKRN